MEPNAYLAMLAILVIIGLALGLYAAFWIGSLANGAPFAFGHGVGTVLVTFGCCAAGCTLMYGVAYQIDRLVRSRRKSAKAERKMQQKTRATKKRRKKR